MFKVGQVTLLIKKPGIDINDTVNAARPPVATCFCLGLSEFPEAFISLCSEVMALTTREK